MSRELQRLLLAASTCFHDQTFLQEPWELLKVSFGNTELESQGAVLGAEI